MPFEIRHFVETNFYLRKDRSTHSISIISMIITQRCAGLRYNDQNLVEKRLILRQRKLQRYSDVVLQTLVKHYKQTSIYCPLMVDFMTGI